MLDNIRELGIGLLSGRLRRTEQSSNDELTVAVEDALASTKITDAAGCSKKQL